VVQIDHLGTLALTDTAGQVAPTASRHASPNRFNASVASMMGMPWKDPSSPETTTLLSMTALTLAALQ
jgi:hypothetical protein